MDSGYWRLIRRVGLDKLDNYSSCRTQKGMRCHAVATPRTQSQRWAPWGHVEGTVSKTCFSYINRRQIFHMNMKRDGRHLRQWVNSRVGESTRFSSPYRPGCSSPSHCRGRRPGLAAPSLQALPYRLYSNQKPNSRQMMVHVTTILGCPCPSAVTSPSSPRRGMMISDLFPGQPIYSRRIRIRTSIGVK